MWEQGKSQGLSALDMNMWSDLNPFAIGCGRLTSPACRRWCSIRYGRYMSNVIEHNLEIDKHDLYINMQKLARRNRQR